MDIKYLEMFNEIEKISSKDFLKEKNKINFFNVSEFSDDQAFMNYRMDGSIYNQFINMYDGYAETSLYLLEECMKNRTSSKKDIWIFPIFFNIIHALELFLKSTNWLLESLKCDFKNEINITYGGHNILQLSKNVYKKIQVSKEFNQFKDDFNLIYKFVNILSQMFKIDTIDENTFIAPRYPISKNNISYKYVEKDSKSNNNFTVKMSNLYIWLLKIYQVCAKFNFYVEDYFIND